MGKAEQVVIRAPRQTFDNHDIFIVYVHQGPVVG